MRKYTFTEKGHTFKRIDKKTARTAYKNGLTVIICPCNLRPFTPWHNEHRINRKDRAQFVVDEIGVVNDFNNLVNSFEYYNCINSETGKYSAFYIPVCTVDRFTGEAPTPATLGTVEQYDYSYIIQNGNGCLDNGVCFCTLASPGKDRTHFGFVGCNPPLA